MTAKTSSAQREQWRLGLALCASAAAHAWLLTAWPEARRPHRLPPAAISANIEVRVIPQEIGSDSIFQAHTLPSQSDAPRYHGNSSLTPYRVTPARGKPNRSATAPVTAPEVPAENTARTLPQPVDLTWYGAHELDAYPQALTPLRFDPPAAVGLGSPGTRLLLWLRIDERGQVVEVKAGEPGVPGEWVDAARASLAAIRFTPARKDERAVKSRLLLSVSLADAGKADGTLP